MPTILMEGYSQQVSFRSSGDWDVHPEYPLMLLLPAPLLLTTLQLLPHITDFFRHITFFRQKVKDKMLPEANFAAAAEP